MRNKEKHGRFQYLPPLSGLRVVLPILSLAQQVWKHQGFEGTWAWGSGIAERVHHPEVSSIAHSAKRAWAQAPCWVQAVDTNHGQRADYTEVSTNHWAFKQAPVDSVFICPAETWMLWMESGRWWKSERWKWIQLKRGAAGDPPRPRREAAHHQAAVK